MRRLMSWCGFSHSIANRLSYFLSFCCLVLVLNSCAPDAISQDRINGKWLVVTAARNGKETKTLEDGYFDFSNDTVFKTNIFSTVEEFPYELKDDKIFQIGGENVVYSIAPSADDSLILSTTIRDYQFLFIAIRDTVQNGPAELE